MLPPLHIRERALRRSLSIEVSNLIEGVAAELREEAEGLSTFVAPWTVFGSCICGLNYEGNDKVKGNVKK